MSAIHQLPRIASKARRWICSNVAGLKVTIQGARGLKNADWTGLSDPYCVCKVKCRKEDGNRQGQTHVIKDSLNPDWNYTHRFVDVAIGPRDYLEFIVYDKGQLPDGVLGNASLEIQHVLPNGFEGPLKLSEWGKKAGAQVLVKVEIMWATSEQQDSHAERESGPRRFRSSLATETVAAVSEQVAMAHAVVEEKSVQLKAETDKVVAFADEVGGYGIPANEIMKARRHYRRQNEGIVVKEALPRHYVWTQRGIDRLKSIGGFDEYGQPSVGSRLSLAIQKAETGCIEALLRKGRLELEAPEECYVWIPQGGFEEYGRPEAGSHISPLVQQASAEVIGQVPRKDIVNLKTEADHFESPPDSTPTGGFEEYGRPEAGSHIYPLVQQASAEVIGQVPRKEIVNLKTEADHFVWTQPGVEYLKSKGRFDEYGRPEAGSLMLQVIQEANSGAILKMLKKGILQRLATTAGTSFKKAQEVTCHTSQRTQQANAGVIEQSLTKGRAKFKAEADHLVWTQSGIDYLKSKGRFAEYGQPAVGSRMAQVLQKANARGISKFVKRGILQRLALPALAFPVVPVPGGEPMQKDGGSDQTRLRSLSVTPNQSSLGDEMLSSYSEYEMCNSEDEVFNIGSVDGSNCPKPPSCPPAELDHASRNESRVLSVASPTEPHTTPSPRPARRVDSLWGLLRKSIGRDRLGQSIG